MAKSKADAPPKHDQQLMEVRPGRQLFWPQCAGGGVRGSGGTVVAADDPLLHRDVRQDAVLRPAREGAVLSTHDNALAVGAYLQAKYSLAPRFVPPKKPDPVGSTTAPPSRAPITAASLAPDASAAASGEA